MGRHALWAAAVAAAGCVGVGAGTASAAPLLYDGFDYTVGQPLDADTNPGTSNQWLEASLPAAGENHVIVADNVGYTGLAPTTGNAVILPRTATSGQGVTRINVPGRPYTRANSDSVFASFTLRLDEIDAILDSDAANPTHRRG